MPCSTSPSTRTFDDANSDHPDEELLSTEALSQLRSPEQLARLADLVAIGELPLPVDLPPDQFEQLVQDVRKRRRQRLVGFIAHAIANDIHRSRDP